MRVQIFFRDVYGNQRMYPANAAAQELAAFAGVKTFNQYQVDKLVAAGAELETVPDPRIPVIA